LIPSNQRFDYIVTFSQTPPSALADVMTPKKKSEIIIDSNVSCSGTGKQG